MSFEYFVGLSPISKLGEEYSFDRIESSYPIYELIATEIDFTLIPYPYLDAESSARLGRLLQKAVENSKAANFYRRDSVSYFSSRSEISCHVEAMVSVTKEFAQFLVESGGFKAVDSLLPKFLEVRGKSTTDELFKGLDPKSKYGEEYLFYCANFSADISQLLFVGLHGDLTLRSFMCAESSERLGRLLQKAVENGKSAKFYQREYKRYFMSRSELYAHVEMLVGITKRYAKFLIDSGGFDAVDLRFPFCVLSNYLRNPS